MKNTDFMKGFLILGDIASKPNETLADKVAYKQRIVWATMNWDSLTDEVKMERLTKLQECV